MVFEFQSVIPVPLKDTDISKSEIWGRQLVIKENGKFVVVSPSGAGKTTFLSILFGIRRDYEGLILADKTNIRNINNKSWSHLRTSSLSFVFQGLNLFDDLTALENIEIKNRLTNYKTSKEIINFCEQLNVSSFLSKKAGKLSFGQKQRIAIVRALCQPFQYILLDEPFSHLDNPNMNLALNLIFQESEKQGAGIIITSVGETYSNYFQNVFHL